MNTEAMVKPFSLLDTRNLRQERVALVDAAQECIRLAQVTSPLRLQDFGRYRGPGWRGEGGLMPHMSVDWYIAEAWNMAKDKLNGARLLEAVAEEPWRRDDLMGDHYDLWLVDHELYDETSLEADAAVVGMSRPGVGFVLSTSPFDEVRLPTYSLIKTAALHELGHMFGLPGMPRDSTAYESGVHCTNRCVMRYAAPNPDAWAHLTQDRLQAGPYCDECTAELKAHFGEGVPRDEAT